MRSRRHGPEERELYRRGRHDTSLSTFLSSKVPSLAFLVVGALLAGLPHGISAAPTGEIQIQEVKINGLPLGYGRRLPDLELEHSWDGKVLRFAYAPKTMVTLRLSSLASGSAEEVGYRYQLLGYDPQPIELEPEEHTIRYRGLPVGQRILRIERIIDSKSQIRNVEIQITAPFWRSTPLVWAYGALSAWLLLSAARWLWSRRRKTSELALEVQRMQGQKLESLSTLAGGVAHDFNNLLVGIFGYAELARLEVEEHSKLAGYLDRIEESANRAAELARQMLFYSGRGSFAVAPLSLSELVREVARELGPSLDGSISILLELERHLPPIEGDAVQLKQLVRNLVLNATEALDSKAGIVVLATGFEVRQEGQGSMKSGDAVAKGNCVFLTVDDTGKGIERQDIDRIFDPFFSTKSPGRGLGLPVVQGIVRGHKGFLKVSSTPGRGSTFRVLFPAAERVKPVLESADEPHQSHWTGSGRVLVIDDEQAVRSVAASFLERLGFDVITADSGEQGLEIFDQGSGSIDWVLLDISLPGIDGIKVAQRLRHAVPDLPIIMSSGFSKEEAFRGQESPANGFIEKPYRQADLERVLRKALRRAEKPNRPVDRSAETAPRT